MGNWKCPWHSCFGNAQHHWYKNFWTCSTQNICWHQICAVRFSVDEVAIVKSCVLSKGITDAPWICHNRYVWASIFSVKRTYYLCSNPTNWTQLFSFQHITAHALKSKLAEKSWRIVVIRQIRQSLFPSKVFTIRYLCCENWSHSTSTSRSYGRLAGS